MTVDGDSRARTHLANERTFLAWFRTGITLVALGLAGAEFLGGRARRGQEVVRLLATLVIATGALVVLVGLVRYRDGRRRIDAIEFRPAWNSMTVVAALAVMAAVVGVAFVWLLQPGP